MDQLRSSRPPVVDRRSGWDRWQLIGRWLRSDQLLSAALVWLFVSSAASLAPLSLITLELGLGAAILLVLLWLLPLDRFIVALGIVACLALSWTSWASLGRAPVVLSNTTTVDVTGTVIELPVVTDQTARLTVTVRAAPAVPTLVGHRVSLEVDSAETVSAGSVIRATTHPIRVSPPTARLDRVRGLAAHLAAVNVAIVGDDQSFAGRLIRLRGIIVERSIELWREPAASLAAGLAVGNRANFDADLAAAMQVTGTTHLVAVSGQNLVVVLWFLALLLPDRPGWIRTSLTLTMVGVCAVLTGGSASVIRAALLVAAATMTQQLGRPVSGLRNLLLLGTLMTVANPYLPVFDLGFQLSFAAVASLMTLSPWLFNRLPGPVWLRLPLSLTLAAYLATAPILAGAFGVVSLSSPIVNLIVQPLSAAAMMAVVVVFTVSFVWLPLAHLGAWISWSILAAMIGIIEWFAHQSLPVLALEPSPWTVWLTTAAVILLPAWISLGRSKPIDKEVTSR